MANDIKHPMDDFTRLSYMIFVTKKVVNGKVVPMAADTTISDSFSFPFVSCSVRVSPGKKKWKKKKVLQQFGKNVAITREEHDRLFDECKGDSSLLPDHITDPVGRLQINHISGEVIELDKSERVGRSMMEAQADIMKKMGLEGMMKASKEETEVD